jgi:hypothetical protein
MKFLRDHKISPEFNNMEENIYRGLQDPSTITELAVLSLYGQAVSLPYMQKMRSKGTLEQNMLDMGTFHDQVKTHINKIISNPDLLLDTETWNLEGHLIGMEWEEPRVFKALKKEKKNLLCLQEMLMSFCAGAREKWTNFSIEFAADGVISSMDKEEKHRAFMPTTNDANEGMLGRWRVWARNFASLSQHRFNGMMMYKENKTEEFMQAKFGDEHYKWIRKRAQGLDDLHQEETRCTELIKAGVQEAEKRRVEEAEKKGRRDELDRQLDATELVLDITKVDMLNAGNVILQINKHRSIGEDGLIPPKTPVRNLHAGPRKDLLKQVISRYLNHHSMDSSATD